MVRVTRILRIVLGFCAFVALATSCATYCSGHVWDGIALVALAYVLTTAALMDGGDAI